MNDLGQDILEEFTERATGPREEIWHEAGLTLHAPSKGPKDNPSAAKARMARFKAKNPNYWRDRYKRLKAKQRTS